MTDHLEQLADQARDAEQRLRGASQRGAAITANARAAARATMGRLDLPDANKRKLVAQATADADAQHAELAAQVDADRKTITRYVAAAAADRPTGPDGDELRRAREYDHLARLVADGSDLAKIAGEAEQVGDLTRLEAARELARHLDDRGELQNPALRSALDKAAGTPAAKLARALEDRAQQGGFNVQVSMHQARKALTEPLDTELGLLGIDYDQPKDGQCFPIDPYRPPADHAERMPAQPRTDTTPEPVSASAGGDGQ